MWTPVSFPSETSSYSVRCPGSSLEEEPVDGVGVRLCVRGCLSFRPVCHSTSLHLVTGYFMSRDRQHTHTHTHTHTHALLVTQRDRDRVWGPAVCCVCVLLCQWTLQLCQDIARLPTDPKDSSGALISSVCVCVCVSVCVCVCEPSGLRQPDGEVWHNWGRRGVITGCKHKSKKEISC